jgi:hypothetical protein
MPEIANLAEQFRGVRARSLSLCAPPSAEAAPRRM